MFFVYHFQNCLLCQVAADGDNLFNALLACLECTTVGFGHFTAGHLRRFLSAVACRFAGRLGVDVARAVSLHYHGATVRQYIQ